MTRMEPGGNDVRPNTVADVLWPRLEVPLWKPVGSALMGPTWYCPCEDNLACTLVVKLDLYKRVMF
jgi:hypothetical protein